MSATTEIETPKTPAPMEPGARQRSRNVAIALGLVVLVVLFYLITIFKMGGSVLSRAI